MENSSIWSLAARCLAGAELDREAAIRARALLAELGATDLAEDDRRDVVRLLGVAARLDRVFGLRSPHMPGLHVFGAEVSPTGLGARWGLTRGVSGAGLRPLQAFRRCIGEAVEYLSQHDFGAIPYGEPLSHSARFGGMAEPAGDPPARIDHCLGRLPPGRATVPVPVDLCWRRAPASRQLRLRFGPGLGCAAGPTFEAAASAAILELIERDALALWWRGGRRGRPVATELTARAGVADMLLRLRAGGSPRHTWFLDLGTEIAVPVMAAISVDAEGRNFAFGTAAALRPEAALTAACMQLGQLELADAVVAAKHAERGETALNDIDRMHLRRSALVSAGWPILHPAGAPISVPDEAGGEATERHSAEGLERLVARLAEHGHEVVLVDQTNAGLGVPVARALAPSLQPDPGEHETGRLAGVRAGNADAGPAQRPNII